MAGKELFGRLLIVMLFVISSVQKFMDTAPFEGMLVGGYKNLYGHIHDQAGFDLPLTPALLGLYSKNLILFTAFLQSFSSLLVLFNNKLGIYIIALLLLSFNIIIHNPMLYPAGPERDVQIMQCLFNFGWMGAALLCCGEKGKVKGGKLKKH